MTRCSLLLSLALLACQRVEAHETGASALTFSNEACGAKGLPDCPTQQWMKSNLQAFQRNKDFARLAESFDRLATREQPGFEGWADLAKQGAAAARAQDASAVQATCRNCHDQMRDRFKQTLRQARLMD